MFYWFIVVSFVDFRSFRSCSVFPGTSGSSSTGLPRRVQRCAGSDPWPPRWLRVPLPTKQRAPKTANEAGGKTAPSTLIQLPLGRRCGWEFLLFPFGGEMQPRSSAALRAGGGAAAARSSRFSWASLMTGGQRKHWLIYFNWKFIL